LVLEKKSNITPKKSRNQTAKKESIHFFPDTTAMLSRLQQALKGGYLFFRIDEKLRLLREVSAPKKACFSL